MDIFQFRNNLIEDYGKFVRSFVRIGDHRVRDFVADEFEQGKLWPEPLIQLNPSFEPGGLIDDLVAKRLLHDECKRIFRRDISDDVLASPFASTSTSWISAVFKD